MQSSALAEHKTYLQSIGYFDRLDFRISGVHQDLPLKLIDEIETFCDPFLSPILAGTRPDPNGGYGSRGVRKTSLH